MDRPQTDSLEAAMRQNWQHWVDGTETRMRERLANQEDGPDDVLGLSGRRRKGGLDVGMKQQLCHQVNSLDAAPGLSQ